MQEIYSREIVKNGSSLRVIDWDPTSLEFSFRRGRDIMLLNNKGEAVIKHSHPGGWWESHWFLRSIRRGSSSV